MGWDKKRLTFSQDRWLHTSVPGVEEGSVEGTEVAQEGLASVAIDDVACFEFVGALAFGAGYLLAVASPIECLQAGAVRAAAVVGPKAVEVSHADEDADVVAGSKNAGGTFLDFCADDIVFARGLAVVTGDVDMAEG